MFDFQSPLFGDFAVISRAFPQMFHFLLLLFGVVAVVSLAFPQMFDFHLLFFGDFAVAYNSIDMVLPGFNRIMSNVCAAGFENPAPQSRLQNCLLSHFSSMLSLVCLQPCLQHSVLMFTSVDYKCYDASETTDTFLWSVDYASTSANDVHWPELIVPWQPRPVVEMKLSWANGV